MGPTDRSESFGREPEVSAASGGHLAPDTSPNPIVDPGRTEVVPVWSPTPDEPSRPSSQRRPRRRGALRRVKRTLRHVDPVSVFKLSLVYYGCFLVVWLIFVAILYAIVSSMGVFETVESLAKAFAVQWRGGITFLGVEKWALLFGILFWVGGSVLNLLLAFLYNVAADVVGGVEMTFVERDL